MKTCSKCKINKDISEFNKNKSKKDGLQQHCRQCNNAYTKKHYENNKQYYIKKSKRYLKSVLDKYQQLKSTLRCTQCGEEHIACLDFHHINPETKVGQVGRMVYLCSKSRLENEMKKCIVLCSNCHRKLHYELKNAGSNPA